jgi:hypothetical protein
MRELKHIKTFENFNSEELDEGLFTRKTEEEKIDNKLLSNFAKTFASRATAHLKAEILNLPLESKKDILKQCEEVKKNPRIGRLKIQKRGDRFIVGGLGFEGNVVSGK